MKLMDEKDAEIRQLGRELRDKEHAMVRANQMLLTAEQTIEVKNRHYTWQILMLQERANLEVCLTIWEQFPVICCFCGMNIPTKS